MVNSDLKKKWLKTIQFLAAYLVAAWTFLQFVDWALNRYQISPYWVDVLLWFFIGIIPSLLIYFYHQERINQRIFHLREKIFIPLNFIVLAITLFIGFGNSDLGATTKDIAYTDEEGNAQSKTITKEEFRIGVPIFEFEKLTENDSIDWWREGIGQLLQYDLEQNKSLSPLFLPYSETADKIRQASLFYEFYIDGTFHKVGDTIEIEVFKRKASNAKILKSQRFTGKDMLSLLDQISIFITEQAGFLETQSIQYLDLPLKSFMSASEEALRLFLDRKYKAAIDLDSTFAMAYLEKTKYNRIFSLSNTESRELAENALQYRQKLPLQKQLEVAIEHSLAYGDDDTAERQVKLQLEVDPNNFNYNLILNSIYSRNRELDKFLKHSEYRFNKDPSLSNANILMSSLLSNKQEEKVLNYIEKYELINPEVRIYKMTPLLFQGKINEAEALLHDVQMTFPQFKNTLKPFHLAVNFLKTTKSSPDKLRKFIGEYRSEYNEQTFTYWLNDDRIMRIAKNQIVQPVILGGENTLVSGLIGNKTHIDELIKDDDGRILGVMASQFVNDNSNQIWFWKEDDDILRAHEAFDNGDLEQALELYTLAFKNNPKHEYIKHLMAHLNYIKDKTPEVLLAQHKSYAGSYGPRQFTIKNGHFYYYREGTELSKVILLPISENEYITRSGHRTLYTFEEESSGKLASKTYTFIVGPDLKFEWEFINNDQTRNYFTRDIPYED